MPRHKVTEEHRRFAKRLRAEQTALEARFWHEVRAKRLDGWKFRRQVPIEGYVADFVCFEARLIVEVDGPLHEREENRLHDAERDAVLREKGFRVLRFDSDIALGRMLDDIRLALAQPPLPTPRWREGPPSPARGEGWRERRRRFKLFIEIQPKRPASGLRCEAPRALDLSQDWEKVSPKATDEG